MGSGGSKKQPQIQVKSEDQTLNDKNVNSGGGSTNSSIKDTNKESGSSSSRNKDASGSGELSKFSHEDSDNKTAVETSHSAPKETKIVTESKPSSQEQKDIETKPNPTNDKSANQRNVDHIEVASEKVVQDDSANPVPGNQKENNTEKSETIAAVGKPVGGPETKISSDVEDRVIPTENVDQKAFDDAINSTCLLVKSDSLLKRVTKNVTKLNLQRALPAGFALGDLLVCLTNLEELDLSHNSLGPQSFRSICLAMCANASILCLNLSDNKTDTDSAECLGKMLMQNKTLSYLNISNNYLGKDYFSRCVGPAIKTNTSLKVLKAENIGSTDLKVLIEGLKENKTLMEIDLSKNCVFDRTAVGKGFEDILKRDDCCLMSLALDGCEMNKVGLEALREGLKVNSSLKELNVNNNEFESLTNLLHFVVVAVTCPNLQVLSVDSAKVKDNQMDIKGIESPKRESPPVLNILSLNDSHISDKFLEALIDILQPCCLPLHELDIGSNEDITQKCIASVSKLTQVKDSHSNLRRLCFGSNKSADGLPEVLNQGHLPHLQYLNVRRSKIQDLHNLSQLFSGGDLTSLIMDGHKIANTDTLAKLLDNAHDSHLTTLSLGSCSLSASDIKPLCDVIKKGMQLQMLKLSGNRLENQGVVDLTEALLQKKTHPLAVLDVSDNMMGDEGAKILSNIFNNKKHKTQLHSLNISGNTVGKDGLLSLVSVIGCKSSLRTLYLQNQQSGLDEREMIEIFTKLAQSLGFTVKKAGENIQKGCSDLPKLPEGLMVNLSGLGGNTGEIGQMMDSVHIRTDFVNDQVPYLTFSDTQQICAYLKNMGKETCVWSMEDWKMITGSNKPTNETPSWLELSNSRDLCVYLSNLPGNATRQKVESVLEMDADCGVEEACLMKDPVTRNINGVGWVLLSDEQSVDKAVDFFCTGQAKIFGQAFVISKVKVKVDDAEDSAMTEKARKDLEERLKLRSKEERDHRQLIQRTTEESWKRHAYRLAHPAYADGRIW